MSSETSVISSSQTPPSTGSSTAAPGLRRVLRLRDLVLLIVGTVIGSSAPSSGQEYFWYLASYLKPSGTPFQLPCQCGFSAEPSPS